MVSSSVIGFILFLVYLCLARNSKGQEVSEKTNGQRKPTLLFYVDIWLLPSEPGRKGTYILRDYIIKQTGFVHREEAKCRYLHYQTLEYAVHCLSGKRIVVL